MAVAIEQKYYAEHLSVVSTPHYHLIGSFLDQNGLERAQQRFPYIVSGNSEAVGLVSLERYVRDHKRFIGGLPASINELEEPFQKTWRFYQGAANEVLCEEYVRTSEMEPGQALVSNRRLDEFIGSQYTCPDALLLSLNEDGKSATLKKIYEFKSRLDDPDLLNPDVPKIKRLFRPGSRSCAVFTETIEQIIGMPVVIPVHDQLPLRAVVAERAHVLNPRLLDKNFDGGFVCIELPNIRRFTYFVLEILTDRVPKQQNWENYFTPVDGKTALTLEATMQANKETTLWPRSN